MATKIHLLYQVLFPLPTEHIQNKAFKTYTLSEDQSITLEREEYQMMQLRMTKTTMDNSVHQVMKITMKMKDNIKDTSFKILAVRWLKLKMKIQLWEMDITILQNFQVNLAHHNQLEMLKMKLMKNIETTLFLDQMHLIRFLLKISW